MPAAEAADCPIGDDELGQLFSLFPQDGAIVLSVSGGADSIALLWLAARWRAARDGGPSLVVATVDHGLRDTSADEAALVGELAHRLGLPHRVLTWRGAKPESGIEEAARDARYALLADLALREPASHLATAHTLDDQAETVLMRLAAGSGPAGLAGIRAREDRDGLVLLRPFLGLRKARLVATLRRDGIAWSEDPMNADPRFARPRLRAASAVLAREGLTPERLGRFAKRIARWDEALSESALALKESLRDGAAPDGSVNGLMLPTVPEEIVLRLFAAEISVAGGHPRAYRPPLERLEALWEAVLQGIVRRTPVRRTLGGAVVTLTVQGRLSFARAAPRRTQQPKGPAAGRKSVHQD